MKKEKNYNLIKKIIIIISIAIISLIPNIISKNVVLADSGFGTSYDSGGSSYSGGSYDYDYDYDYDSGDYSSDDSGDISMFAAIVGFTILIIIIVAICMGSSTSNQSTSGVVPSKSLPDENAIENKIKSYIPNFNKQEFLDNGYNIYKDVQNAWMNFKLEDVKDEITDELYNMYESQLTTLEVKGEQNIMKDFKVVKSYLKDAVVQNNTITITTGYVIQMYDYIIEKSTGKVIRGSSNNKLKIVYEMKFRRTLDESAKIDKCPNCGAKIDMNTSGICEYCVSKLVSENTKWVLTEKKTIRQETI